MMNADEDCIVDAETVVVAAVCAGEGTRMGVVGGGKEGTEKEKESVREHSNLRGRERNVNARESKREKRNIC